MNTKRLMALLVLVLMACGCTDSGATVDTTSHELTAYEQEDIVRGALELYGYEVVNVVVDVNSELGDYVVIGMVGAGASEYDILSQVSAGYGAMYGMWSDKDNYIVALSAGETVCRFGIDGAMVSGYMSGAVTATAMFSAIESECVLI